MAIALTACVNDSDEGSEATDLVRVGDNVPAFTLYDSDGTTVTSSGLNGQVYILNFFDTTCPDCQRELKVLQQIYDKHLPRPLILNVPRSQTSAEVKEYWDKAGLTMPFYTPADKQLYYKFATKTIPRTYVVDGSGTVYAAFNDSPTADYATLDALLQQLYGTDEGSVRLSLRLKVAAPLGGSGDYYFQNEYTISYLEIWFFDAATKQFFTKAGVRGLTKDDTPHNAQYDITYIFENLKLRAGVYDIFAIANYDHAPEKVADEEEFLNTIDSITYRDGIEANMPDHGPVMTSRVTQLLDVDLVPWVNKSYMLTIDIERVMAKLQIGVSQNTFELAHNGTKYADINITNYKLVNLNRQYYLFQHRDSLTELGSQPQFTLPFNFSDYSDSGEQYVVDPLFYKKTPTAADARQFGSYYKSWFGAFTTEDFASMPSSGSYGYAYILENTAFKTAQKNGYTPGIVFKAAVSPVLVYLYDNSLHTLKEEYRPEYWPRVIYLYNHSFYGSIQAVNAASGLTLDELETYNDEQLKAYGIKQCKFNMGVYETYYTYWIRHRTQTEGSNGRTRKNTAVLGNVITQNDTEMGPMEYGIVRNNFYRIVINGVSGLGNSTVTPDIMRNNHPNSYSDISF